MGKREDFEEIYPLDSGGFTQFLTGIKEQTPSIQLKCTINELVDKDRLRDAVEKTLNIFNTFKVTLALGGPNQIPVYKVNSKDVDVYFYDGEPHNYGKESNGYFFRVYYFDKSILLSFNHILTDAFGVSEFLKCILFFYFNIFDNHELEIRKRLKVDPDDFRDPYALYGNPDCESFSMKDKWQNEVVVPNEMKYRKGEPVNGHRIVFSIQDFIKISKKAESSVFPFMSWLVSNAIARTYGDENKLVTGAGAYNCRKMFNSSTPRSFSQSYVTVFHPKERSMNLEQQLTIQRGRMDIETEEGTISKSIAERKNFMDRMIGNARDYIFNQQSRDQERKISAEKSTYFGSYFGHFDLDEALEEYIDDIDLIGTVTRVPIVFIAYERMENLYLNVLECACEGTITEAIMGIINDLGIRVRMLNTFEKQFDSYPLEELYHD